MTERTKGVITLSIVQLINAAGVCAVGIIVLLADGGWLNPNGVLITELGGVLGVVFFIFLLTAIILGITGDLTMAIVLIFFVWGILGLVATVGLSKLRRWARWLTPIHNIPLIVLLILVGIGSFWRPLSFWVIIPILVMILLVINRGDFE